MSRPVAWNGAQWVDPAFWTGSEWKSYIPPLYDVPSRYDFTSDAEGWKQVPYQSEGDPCVWSGGAIYADAVDVGAAQCYSPEGSGAYPGDGLPDPLPQGIRFAVRWRVTDWQDGSGFAPGNQTYTIARQGLGTDANEFEVVLPPGNVDWRTDYTAPGYTWLNPMYVGGQQAGLAAPSFNLWVDWMEYQYADGSPVLQLGDPGWQPYAYDGRDWI